MLVLFAFTVSASPPICTEWPTTEDVCFIESQESDLQFAVTTEDCASFDNVFTVSAEFDVLTKAKNHLAIYGYFAPDILVGWRSIDNVSLYEGLPITIHSNSSGGLPYNLAFGK